MALPKWMNEVCAAPDWQHWKQPAEVRSWDRRYAVRTTGDSLFAWRAGDERLGQMPAKNARGISGWLRRPAPLRVSSQALLEFLASADENRVRDTFGINALDMSPVGIGEDIYDARLLLRDLRQIEDWPDEVRIGITAPRLWCGRKYHAVLIAAPRWRYVAMAMDKWQANCWRLEDAVAVRP